MKNLSMSLQCKLASIAVHADELTSPEGHEHDRAALRAVLEDPEVKEWVSEMVDQSLAPRKRNIPPVKS